MEGKLDRYKGRIKQAWGDLTDDDIRRAEGSVDRLVGIIKDRTGQDQQEIEKRLKELEKEEENT